MRKYSGNIEKLLKKYSAKKKDDILIVEKIYKVYLITIKSRLSIEIMIEPQPEEEDNIIFKILSGYNYIPLSIGSDKDLQLLLRIIS